MFMEYWIWQNSFIEKFEKKIDKVQIYKFDEINNKTIFFNLNKFDCLIIDNYQNDIEENYYIQF